MGAGTVGNGVWGERAHWAVHPGTMVSYGDGDGDDGDAADGSRSSVQRKARSHSPDVQAKRKIRRARRQERNAAMRYEELLFRLDQLIQDSGGAEYVTTEAIVRLYQVRAAVPYRGSRMGCVAL